VQGMAAQAGSLDWQFVDSDGWQIENIIEMEE
jgi:hypothetical protein